jgi:hypothetical protein
MPKLPLGLDRLQRAEEDVGDVGRDHRPAPAVGEPGAQTLQQQVVGVVVDADVRAVHHLDDLAVDAARHDPPLPPALEGLLGGALDRVVDRAALLAAEVVEEGQRHLLGDVVDRGVAVSISR